MKCLHCFLGMPIKHYVIAIFKREDTSIQSIKDVKGKRSCHVGAINNPAGWDVPLSLLAKDNEMTVHKCNDDLRNAYEHFSSSCAPGVWYDDIYKSKLLQHIVLFPTATTSKHSFDFFHIIHQSFC